jgi:hypothetical protein
MPMPRKAELSDNEKAAVAAYIAGAKATKIIKDHSVSFSQLYRCLDYEGVELRTGKREVYNGEVKVKGERPKKQPLVFECAWCRKSLSRDQVYRRRKYCCLDCEKDGMEDERLSKLKPCQAPGCSEYAMEETDYCSWRCLQIALEARFNAKTQSEAPISKGGCQPSPRHFAERISGKDRAKEGQRGRS